MISEVVDCEILGFALLETVCQTVQSTSASPWLFLGETWLGHLGVLEWWVGLATVNKHTGREGVFCCEFRRKAQHEK